jgi:hypothetical protein
VSLALFKNPTGEVVDNVLAVAKKLVNQPLGNLPPTYSETPEEAKEFAKSVSDIEVKKAWTASDIASAGAMPAGYGRRFLDSVIHGSPLLSQCTVIMMREDKRHIDRIGFTGRVLYPAVGENSAQTSEAEPSTARVTLDVEEFDGKIEMSYSVLEDVIEHAGQEAILQGYGEGTALERFVALAVVEAIMARLAPALRRDIEYYALLSDTALGSGALSKFDGWLKSAASNEHDQSAATVKTIDDLLFLNTILALPAVHQADRSQLKFIAGPMTELYWRHYINKNAGSGLANAALSAAGHRDIPGMQGPNGRFGAYGIALDTVGQMPEAETTTANKGRILLANPRNLVLGVKRNLTVETDRQVGKRSVLLVPQIRMDAKLADPTAAAIGKLFTVGVAA